MYSLNVPVPGRVARVAADLAPALAEFETVRDEHTLVAKRLGDPGGGEHAHVRGRVRAALAGTGAFATSEPVPPFEVRIAGLDCFERPAAGPGPVVYLAVESPGLEAIHRRLAAVVPPVPDVEGDDYVPHVTLARGGDLADARSLADRRIEPVTWTAEELVFWDARHDGPAGRVRLPPPP